MEAMITGTVTERSPRSLTVLVHDAAGNEIAAVEIETVPRGVRVMVYDGDTLLETVPVVQPERRMYA